MTDSDKTTIDKTTTEIATENTGIIDKTTTEQQSTDTTDTAVFKAITTILTDIIAKNDKQLISNILDTTGKIILTENDLKVVIATVIGNVNTTDISITTTDDELADVRCSCCLKSCNGKFNPFKAISKITIGEHNIKEKYIDKYNYIKNNLNISIQRIHT